MHKGLSVGLLAFAATAVSVAWETPARKVAYSSLEREFVRAFWNAPGRYKTALPPSAEKSGAYDVRLTPEGSLFLWKMNNGLGRGKTSASLKPMPSWDEVRSWDNWVNTKIEHDRWEAAKEAAFRNGRPFDKAEPEKEGSMPSRLRDAFGDAPSFAEAVKPTQHIVDFGEGTILALTDNPNMRPTFAYYRSPMGVMSGGTPVKNMPADEMRDLFNEAGVSLQAQKVMKAVSLLEGGFDSVNTYDTGFVSVGFIQFACLSTGSGSLGLVLKREKEKNPEAFHRDFRRFGIEVTDNAELVALDLDSGEEKFAFDAAKEIIQDKRLIAVFQRAGRTSKAFRIAQLQVAHEQYYPAKDTITVSTSSGTITGTVGDVIRTEAGMATLMDRKVNTGRIDPLPALLSKYANSTGADSLDDLAAYEYNIVQAIKYRKDYTRDDSLSQPNPAQLSNSTRDGGSKVSRKGKRLGRKK